MAVVPTELVLTEANRLRITWSDQQVREYQLREFHERCPCATCREKRRQPPPTMPLLTVISPEEAQPLKLTKIDPVGNYAYSLRFNHGCQQGIFTFEFLRELGQIVST